MHCGVLHIGGCIGKIAGKAAGDAFDQIAKDFGRTAQHVTVWLWGQIGSATEVRIGGPGWGKYLAITAILAAVVGVGLFCLQVTAAALRRDTGGMGRAFRGLLVAFVAGGAAIGVTQIVLAATDAVANGIMQVGLGTTNWQTAGSMLIAGGALAALSSSSLLLMSFAMIGAVVVVWLALAVRKLLLIINAVFAPIAFAGSLADVTASWTRKWIEYTLALAASKIILVLVFVIGLGVLDNGLGMTGGGAGQQVTQVVVGLLILCVAGLAPWMAVKVVHFAGDAFHEIHSHGRAAMAAGQTAVAAPQKVTQWAQQKLPGSGRGGGGGQMSSQRSGAPPSSNGSAPSGSPQRPGAPSSSNGSAPTGSPPSSSPSTATGAPGGAGPGASGAGGAAEGGAGTAGSAAAAAAKEGARKTKEGVADAVRKGQAASDLVGGGSPAGTGSREGPGRPPSPSARPSDASQPRSPARRDSNAGTSAPSTPARRTGR